jgi:hypothetical protein
MRFPRCEIIISRDEKRTIPVGAAPFEMRNDVPYHGISIPSN